MIRDSKRDDHRLHRWIRIILDDGLRRMTRIVLTIKEIMMNYGNSFTVLFILFSLNMNVHQCPCN